MPPPNHPSPSEFIVHDQAKMKYIDYIEPRISAPLATPNESNPAYSSNARPTPNNPLWANICSPKPVKSRVYPTVHADSYQVWPLQRSEDQSLDEAHSDASWRVVQMRKLFQYSEEAAPRHLSNANDRGMRNRGFHANEFYTLSSTVDDGFFTASGHNIGHAS